MKLYDKGTAQMVDFNIPAHYKKIAVNCSGGADSSILLYTLIRYLEENSRTDTKVTVLTCANDLKGRWNARNAAAVINFVIENTNTNIIDSHIAYYRDLQKTEYFHEIELDLFANNKIDLVISGVTANPREKTTVLNVNNQLVDLKDEALPERNSTNQAQWHTSINGHWYKPFVNIDKKMIAAIYKQFDVTESLLPLTRSCEAFADVTDNFTKPCGECWWCLERKWAFGIF